MDLNWDIGAYELVGGAAPTGQVIMISGIPIILIGAAVIAFRKEAA